MVLAGQLSWTELETIVSMQEVLDHNVLYDAWSESKSTEVA